VLPYTTELAQNLSNESAKLSASSVSVHFSDNVISEDGSVMTKDVNNVVSVDTTLSSNQITALDFGTTVHYTIPTGVNPLTFTFYNENSIPYSGDAAVTKLDFSSLFSDKSVSVNFSDFVTSGNVSTKVVHNVVSVDTTLASNQIEALDSIGNIIYYSIPTGVTPVSIDYTPNQKIDPNQSNVDNITFNGGDTFKYTIADSSTHGSSSSTANATIYVNEVAPEYINATESEVATPYQPFNTNGLDLSTLFKPNTDLNHDNLVYTASVVIGSSEYPIQSFTANSVYTPAGWLTLNGSMLSGTPTTLYTTDPTLEAQDAATQFLSNPLYSTHAPVTIKVTQIDLGGSNPSASTTINLTVKDIPDQPTLTYQAFTIEEPLTPNNQITSLSIPISNLVNNGFDPYGTPLSLDTMNFDNAHGHFEIHFQGNDANAHNAFENFTLGSTKTITKLEEVTTTNYATAIPTGPQVTTITWVVTYSDKTTQGVDVSPTYIQYDPTNYGVLNGIIDGFSYSVNNGNRNLPSSSVEDSIVLQEQAPILNQLVAKTIPTQLLVPLTTTTDLDFSSLFQDSNRSDPVIYTITVLNSDGTTSLGSTQGGTLNLNNNTLQLLFTTGISLTNHLVTDHLKITPTSVTSSPLTVEIIANNATQQSTYTFHLSATADYKPIANPLSFTINENNNNNGLIKSIPNSSVTLSLSDSSAVPAKGIDANLLNDVAYTTGDNISFIFNTSNLSGTFANNIYTPPSNMSSFNGVDTFTYQAIDTTRSIASQPTTITVHVNAISPIVVSPIDVYDKIITSDGKNNFTQDLSTVFKDVDPNAQLTYSAYIVNDTNHDGLQETANGLLGIAGESQIPINPNGVNSEFYNFTFDGTTLKGSYISGKAGTYYPDLIKVVATDPDIIQYILPNSTISKVHGDTIQTAPTAHGLVQIDLQTGSYDYFPNTGDNGPYNGPDSFYYEFQDLSKNTIQNATVNLVSNGMIIHGQSLSNAEIIQYILPNSVTSNDAATGDTLQTASTANGSVTVDLVTGQYTYSANVGYNGPDSFNYELKDLLSNTATLTNKVNSAQSGSVIQGQLSSPIGGPSTTVYFHVSTPSTSTIPGTNAPPALDIVNANPLHYSVDEHVSNQYNSITIPLINTTDLNQTITIHSILETITVPIVDGGTSEILHEGLHGGTNLTFVDGILSNYGVSTDLTLQNLDLSNLTKILTVNGVNQFNGITDVHFINNTDIQHVVSMDIQNVVSINMVTEQVTYYDSSLTLQTRQLANGMHPESLTYIPIPNSGQNAYDSTTLHHIINYTVADSQQVISSSADLNVIDTPPGVVNPITDQTLAPLVVLKDTFNFNLADVFKNFDTRDTVQYHAYLPDSSKGNVEITPNGLMVNGSAVSINPNQGGGGWLTFDGQTLTANLTHSSSVDPLLCYTTSTGSGSIDHPIHLQVTAVDTSNHLTHNISTEDFHISVIA